jgi:hypothetical protein
MTIDGVGYVICDPKFGSEEGGRVRKGAEWARDRQAGG